MSSLILSLVRFLGVAAFFLFPYVVDGILDRILLNL